MAEFRKIAREVHDSYSTPGWRGVCETVSTELAPLIGGELVHGFYCVDELHCWVVVDDLIVDATVDQWGEQDPVRIVGRQDPRYVPWTDLQKEYAYVSFTCGMGAPDANELLRVHTQSDLDRLRREVDEMVASWGMG